MLNAGVASVAVLHQRLSGNHVALVATISTGVTFAKFAAIVVCHAVKQLLSSKQLRRLKIQSRIIAKIHKRGSKKVEEQNSSNDKIITHTSVELYEPLVS